MTRRRLITTCPVLDNNHGTEPPFAHEQFIIAIECPLHGEPTDE